MRPRLGAQPAELRCAGLVPLPARTGLVYGLVYGRGMNLITERSTISGTAGRRGDGRHCGFAAASASSASL